MQQTVPVHGNPENKVFGLKGSIVGTNLGKLFVKQDKDTLNVGWGELTSIVTTTASPITTTTAGGTTTTTAGATTTTTAGGTTTTAGGTTTTAGGTTTTAGGTTTTAGGTTTTEEVTTTTEEGGTTTPEGPPGTYTEVSINFSPDPINAPTRFDVSAVANVSGLVFISHEIFIQASYEDLGPGLPVSGYDTSIALNTSPSGPEGTDTISVSNAQNTVGLVVPYYVYVKSVLTTNGGVFESKAGGLKQYGVYPGLLSAPATEGFESFP